MISKSVPYKICDRISNDFLGAFAKWRKTIFSFIMPVRPLSVCLPVCAPASNDSAIARQIFVTFDIEYSSKIFQVSLKYDINNRYFT
jgi:hypothetical protein